MWPLLAQTEPQGIRGTIDQLARTPISLIVYICAIATAIRLVIYWYMRDVPSHQRGLGYMVAKYGGEAMDALVYALIFVFLLIRPFGVQAFTIPSASMYPTLKINDFIIANKAIYRYSEPKVDDIIVFKPPAKAILEYQKGQDIDYIKRVQGVPGDVVEIRGNVLYRNGRKVAQPYVHFTRQISQTEYSDVPIGSMPSMDFKLVKHNGSYWPVVYNSQSVNFGSAPIYQVRDPAEEEDLRNDPPVAVPPGFLLVMGDNRNYSYDGRYWGLFERSRVIGRAEFIWLPPSRWGLTR